MVVDRNAAALDALRAEPGEDLLPMPLDLLDAAACATLVPHILALPGQLDVFHANAGLCVGGDLIDASQSPSTGC